MNTTSEKLETICAVATPAGRGGVSVIRISGPQAFTLAKTLTGKNCNPNTVQYCSFRNSNGEVLDNGLVLYFKNPVSFTGEDVVELQFHGSPVVADEILLLLNNQGARLARPGEFSERAFLNEKLDLSQAEAIADLINSRSAEAAKYAVRSLRGAFSQQINIVVRELTDLRVFIEAAIDFPEEEVDFLSDERIGILLKSIQEKLKKLISGSRNGVLLNEGIKAVIVGEPNAGKSSLLNELAGYNRAIVTDIPGTTRDLLELVINIKGIPIQFIDTAGLRVSDDPIEQEGIKRTRKAMIDSDVIFLLIDNSKITDHRQHPLWIELSENQTLLNKAIIVMNKIDLLNDTPKIEYIEDKPIIKLSVLKKTGLELIDQALIKKTEFAPTEEGSFLARRRHIDALLKASMSVEAAQYQLEINRAGEMAAEDLRIAQDQLGEITGKISSDELLGKIFNSFCIGK